MASFKRYPRTILSTLGTSGYEISYKRVLRAVPHNPHIGYLLTEAVMWLYAMLRVQVACTLASSRDGYATCRGTLESTHDSVRGTTILDYSSDYRDPRDISRASMEGVVKVG